MELENIELLSQLEEEKGRNIALEQELKAEKVELQSMLEKEKGKNKALEQVIKNVKVGWKRRMEHLMKIATLEEEINILEKIIYNHFCFITFFLSFFFVFPFLC